MKWSEICKTYPDQWLVVEAMQAHTTADHQRLLDELAVVEKCADGSAALLSYRRLHRQHPGRELYYLHTSRPEPDIVEQPWIGIRRGRAHTTAG